MRHTCMLVGGRRGSRLEKWVVVGVGREVDLLQP